MFKSSAAPRLSVEAKLTGGVLGAIFSTLRFMSSRGKERRVLGADTHPSFSTGKAWARFGSVAPVSSPHVNSGVCQPKVGVHLSITAELKVVCRSTRYTHHLMVIVPAPLFLGQHQRSTSIRGASDLAYVTRIAVFMYPEFRRSAALKAASTGTNCGSLVLLTSG